MQSSKRPEESLIVEDDASKHLESLTPEERLSSILQTDSFAMPKREESFSFCVGRPRKDGVGNPIEASVSVYAYGSQVHYGSMEKAESFREYVNERTGEENFIYRLVKVDEAAP